jgi:hypothetical protein
MTTPINSQGGGGANNVVPDWPNPIDPEYATELARVVRALADDSSRIASTVLNGELRSPRAVLTIAANQIERFRDYCAAVEPRRASTGGERERLKELEDTLSEIARGDVPSPSFGHYLAHRHAVKLARRALSASSGKGVGDE